MTRQPPIVWTEPLTEIGETLDGPPHARLLGTVTILGADFHVDAVEVNADSEGEQRAAHPGHQCVLDEILEIVEGAGQTVEIDGRPYVLSITPFQE